uniref:non-specific serine/threonine protein kinase n=1 Tax=Populus alba TaxID=43335 RepID=A0A4U5LS75_POPAL|nr:putative leucine-rich repeat receptor-like protein kinase [Populus alba]
MGLGGGTARLLLLTFFTSGIHLIFSDTDPSDAAALQSLKRQWQNTPPSWGQSPDPCGAPWEGVTCSNSRITALGLSTMNLKGKLSGDIGGLTELRSLDLSFNTNLTGSLTPRLGDLLKLNILILAGCGFSGSIPDELGNLAELSFLALNSNNFSGGIPPSLGKLSKLYWLDLADNQLTGPIPISKNTTPGLDLLLNAKHFHFNKNQLSGSIPPELFSSDMVLIHVLFDGNQLEGNIPSTLGLVQTLEVLRLDRNALSGKVPKNLNNLSSLNELNLAHNKLIGPLPNLTKMDALNYVDLSNNSFYSSEAPDWFSTLPSLTTLVIEHGSLQGTLPSKVFSFPQIQQVLLRNNALNGSFNMGDSISTQLQLVDLQNNQISSVTLTADYTNTLILVGNPVCTALSDTNYCQLQQQSTRPYSTSLANCGSKMCPPEQKLSPQSCECAYPYEGTLYFRAPSFRELSNVNMFHSLEMSLWGKLGLTPGSVFLQDPFFNVDDYLQVQVALFPPSDKYFNRSEIQSIGFDLTNQTYKPPKDFGPYYFIASPYPFPDASRGSSMSTGVVVGIGIGCGLLVMSLVGVGIYAIRQKKRAEKAIGLSKPFASWAPSGKDSGGVPQLKGARWFSYEELKRCTYNFTESNEIGFGGYGKGSLAFILTGEGDFALLLAAKQPIEKGKYIVREVRMAMDRNDEEHYGLKQIMDPGLRNMGGNLVGFGRFLELAMQCVEESATERPTMSEVVKAIEMILQNDGVNTNSTTSASSSATDFGASRGGGPLRHPYNHDVVAAKNKVDVVDNINNNNAFDYSGGYTLSAKVEPK